MVDTILMQNRYWYTSDVKNPVRNITIMNMLNNPRWNDNISLLLFDFKLKATKIGMIGKMHGDSIEITPVRKEMNGIISI